MLNRIGETFVAFAIANVNSGLVLEAQGTGDGADVVQANPDGTASQRLTLEAL